MNVFYLDNDPDLCAQYHNDKHVVKMCIEYAQLMSTAHRVLDGSLWYGKTINGRKIARYFLEDGEMNEVLYKASHLNHPSNRWVRASTEHYEWLYNTWTSLCNEYRHRYGKVHESFRKLEVYLLLPPKNMPTKPFVAPPPAMSSFPECIVENDSIKSYRNYYWKAKAGFCVWSKRQKPEWWVDYEISA